MESGTERTCELFYHSFNIPVYAYDHENTLLFFYPQASFHPEQLLSLFPDDSQNDIAVISDRNSLFWGQIRLKDSVLIIGPVSMTVFSDRIRHSLMARHFIGNEYEDEFESILNMIPRLSLFRFSSSLRILYQMLTGIYINDSDVRLAEVLRDKQPASNEDLQSKVLSVFYENIDRGLELYDISYDAEQKMIKNIESCNIEALSRSFSADDSHKFGSLADTTMRSTKNMFIVVIAIASRVAIRNGLSVQVAYKLSDLYIQEIEQTANFRVLTELVRNAVIDYAQRIKALRVPRGLSPMIHEAMQYIEQSVTQPLSVADVADYVGRSVSWFSAEFKKETGMNVSTYITACRVDEAKRLLKYTNLPLAYISNFLCFSSQSHFQKVFRNVTGMTPLAYRTKKHSP